MSCQIIIQPRMSVYLIFLRNLNGSKTSQTRGILKHFDFLLKLHMCLLHDVLFDVCQQFLVNIFFSSSENGLRRGRQNVSYACNCKEGCSPSYVPLSGDDRSSVGHREMFTGRERVSKEKRNYLHQHFQFSLTHQTLARTGSKC